jgi:PAS domain S-box-containing protein
MLGLIETARGHLPLAAGNSPDYHIRMSAAFPAAATPGRQTGGSGQGLAETPIASVPGEDVSSLRALADAVPQIVWGAGPTGGIDFSNRRWLEYTGLPDSAPSTARFLNQVHPDDVTGVSALWRDVLTDPREFRHIYRLRRADGAYRWHLAVGRPHRDPATGAVLRWFGGLVDVDAEQRAQADVQRAVEQRTRERDQIWQASPDMLCTAALDGRLIAVSAAWIDTLGWTAEELKAVPYASFIHPDDVAATAAMAGRLAEGQPVFSFENRFRHRDGSYRWFSWNSVCHDGLIFATVRDVTALREQAETQRRLEDQLRQAQKMEAVGQLTGGIAHDFNNLLAGIAGSLELIGRALDSGRLADLPRLLATAQGATARGAALTQRLLAFSRRQALDPRPTDANSLIDGMHELIARTVGPAISLHVAPAAGLWTTLCDPSQLDNALLNLAINARDAMPQGGCLSFATANATLDAATAERYELPPGPYVCVSVTDTGTGMAPDVVARAFDPFFTTKQIGEGTGLGLSMIYGFARQSGGQVRIDSAPGRGTTVRIYLPRHTQPLAAIGPDRPAPTPAPSQATVHPTTVLLIDDEATLRMLMTTLLIDEGFEVRAAADGPAGLRLLREGGPVDLLVTDMGLPGGMNGRQVATAAQAVQPGLPVLFITGYDERAALDGYPSAHILTKPFPLGVLVDHLRAMAGAQTATAA